LQVVYQGANHAFAKSVHIEGVAQWSRFGLAVAAAGDLNGDGANGKSFLGD
jgi:hypothetical protein